MESLSLPILTLSQQVLFPSTYLRLSVTSAAALQLLKDLVWEVQANKNTNRRGGVSPSSLALAVFTQKPRANDDDADESGSLTERDLYSVGTVARVVQLTRMQGGSSGLSVLVQGLHRIEIKKLTQTRPYMVATVNRIPPIDLPPRHDDLALDALANKLKQLTQEFLELSKSTALLRKSNALIGAISTSSIGELADVVVSYLNVDVEAKQSVLAEAEVQPRCTRAIELLKQAIEKAKLQRKIETDVQDKLEGTRKEFLLRQQLEAIKKELGETGEDGEESNELKQLEDRIQALELNPKAAKVAHREMRRLKGMNSSQPEYGIIHNYLEFFADLPWNTQTEDSLVVDHVRKQLDADHYGLEKVKKRITEYIAVRSLKKDMKGPILCLVGPPGVGKTSLGKSVAIATNRNFERIAFGGVHDESEIRGHRKTYIGAMPGCILNALRHAESKNPVLLLDEVDKIGKDFRGDPSSALLEVLDPHQNHTFTDHYLNVPFDLSSVMFIATANSLDTIPAPLLDRMEIIEVSGYTVEQKIEIAKRYLVPRQVEENGLQPQMVQFSDAALRYLIMSYTREAGVRDLERQLAAICRYIAVSVVKTLDGKKLPKSSDGKTDFSSISQTIVDQAMIQTILGHELVFNEVALRSSVPGVATGMSWSTVGGSILFVEASCTRPSASQMTLNALTASRPTSAPTLQLTGKLGDVMKESAQLALSWLRAHAHSIELPKDEHDGVRMLSMEGITDVHVHFPEGAIPKDGPSAGGAIVCALLSVISGIPVPVDISMTGEITLRGVILPVGGIREKVLAAIRAGIKRIILPKGNASEAQELQKEFALLSAPVSTGELTAEANKENVELLFVSNLKELVGLVFGMKLRDEPNFHSSSEKPPTLLSML